MDWVDTGIVLSARRHGETSAVVHVLTQSHGRCAGLVRGGAGRRARSIVQTGNEVQASWRARLPQHLGTFTLELVRPRAARVLPDPLRLAALTAAAEILDAALPEREPHPGLFADLCQMLDAVEDDATDWMPRYANWELALLSTLGFGLDLAALPGDGPWAVSERTGEIVAAADDRNALPLPGILTAAADRDAADRDDPAAPARALAQALRVTGAFLRRAVADPRNLRARTRLVERLGREKIVS